MRGRLARRVRETVRGNGLAGRPAPRPGPTSQLCAMTGTLICDEDGLYDPRNFNDRLVLGMKGQISEYELHFIRARLRGGQLSRARRGELIMPLPVGLVYDAGRARHPRSRHRHPGRAAAPVHHVRGHRVGHRGREGVPRRRAVLPLAAPERTPQGRGRLAAAAPPRGAAGAAQPALRRRVHLRPAPRADAARRETEPASSCPATSGPPSSPAPTPATSPWASTRPTSPSWRPTPPRTAATGPPGRPAKAPPCCRASSSAAAAAGG